MHVPISSRDQFWPISLKQSQLVFCRFKARCSFICVLNMSEYFFGD